MILIQLRDTNRYRVILVGVIHMIDTHDSDTIKRVTERQNDTCDSDTHQ